MRQAAWIVVWRVLLEQSAAFIFTSFRIVNFCRLHMSNTLDVDPVSVGHCNKQIVKMKAEPPS